MSSTTPTQGASAAPANAPATSEPAAGTVSTSPATTPNAPAEKITPLHPHYSFLHGIAVILEGLARQTESLAAGAYKDIASDLRSAITKISAKL